MGEIYKCNVCGELLNNSDLIFNKYKGCYEDDYGVYSLFNTHNYYEKEKKACPFCRCEELKEGYICDTCGKFITSLIDDVKLCVKCYKKYNKDEEDE